MNLNGHMTKLTPKELEQHLERMARAMRECYSSRCAQDYEDAAACIRDLRLGNTPRVDALEIHAEVVKAISLVRASRTTRALMVLHSLLERLARHDSDEPEEKELK